MTDMPKRDTEGKCDEGECRDREKEGYAERQSKIEGEHKDVESPEEYPSAPKAKKRNEPPGSMGGHV
jgi:hypothetical protein